MYLLLLDYNNYYNRVIKKETTINDYENASTNHSWIYETGGGTTANINFKPNDGVSTKQVINWSLNWIPNYVVCWNEDWTINSRWFVLETTRLRDSQYQLELRRDLVADNMDDIKTSVGFIKKGTPYSIDDYMIYNKERFNFNQIQKKETKLKDKSQVAWLIGYFQGSQDTIGVEATPRADVVANTKPTLGTYRHLLSLDFTLYAKNSNSNTHSYWLMNKGYGKANGDDYVATLSVTGNGDKQREEILSILNSKSEQVKSTFLSNNSSYKENAPSTENNGLLYFITSENKYYYLTIEHTGGSAEIIPTKGSTEEAQLNDLIESNLWTYPNSLLVSQANTKYNVTYDSYTYKWDEVKFETLTAKIPTTARNLNDAPYKMFAIPYGETDVYAYEQAGVDKEFTSFGKEIALNTAKTIFTTYDSENETGVNCYDIQLLPYFPIPNKLLAGKNGVCYEGLTENFDYSFIKDGSSNKKGIVFFPRVSSFKAKLDNVNIIQCPSNIEDFKVENETSFMRLSSPNYASTFEFKVTNNKKSITDFMYACTYKPYNPYINVYPTPISGLYGKDFNNNFGLIVKGDFSISLMNDAWKQYQLNNKNYENSFNRQIKTLDLDIRQSKIQGNIGAVAGTIQGASAGAQMGGVYGAIAGGVISGIAGAVDITENLKKMQDTRNAMIDQHYYQLGNVKAMPQTLTNVSTIDINNKLFPILEEFSASDDEKNILRYQLRYRGYTIQRIDSILTYWRDYLEALIIRSEVIEDTHLLNEINYELEKGVYIE